MNFINEMLFGHGVAHSIFVLAIVITLGTALSKIKIGGVSLGSTWVLFAGILASHFGMTIGSDMLNFARDFGLTLFVFSIGLQIGPGFFSSLRSGGLKLMWLSLLVMLCGAVVTYLITIALDLPLQTMVTCTASRSSLRWRRSIPISSRLSDARYTSLREAWSKRTDCSTRTTRTLFYW